MIDRDFLAVGPGVGATGVPGGRGVSGGFGAVFEARRSTGVFLLGTEGAKGWGLWLLYSVFKKFKG